MKKKKNRKSSHGRGVADSENFLNFLTFEELRTWKGIRSRNPTDMFCALGSPTTNMLVMMSLSW